MSKMDAQNKIINKLAYLRKLFLGKYFPKKLADELYCKYTRKKEGINWLHPKDLNEKINWLKFNSDTSLWTRLTDKYEVRNYIKEKGFENILVRLYGVWESASLIDFDLLPESFVLKTNHGSGTVWIIRDKQAVNWGGLVKDIDKSLKDVFGYCTAEPHYKGIKPLVIAEELLSDECPFSKSLVDYKVWCFDGEVFGTWVCYNRIGYDTYTEWHDVDWKYRPEWSVFNEHYKDGKGIVPCPQNYEYMIAVAKKMSLGFPQVRVDLYNINGEIYFGEMTFTSGGGYMNFYSKEALDQMGKMVNCINTNLVK